MKDIIEILGWPNFSFLFALVFVFLFRTQLAGLISRVTSIDRSGVKAGPIPEAQREDKKSEAVHELLVAIGDSIVLREVESRIKNDLKDRELDTDGSTTKVLIKHLAASKVLLEFEQIHNLILGSQIVLLKRLNEVVGQGQKKEFVVAHFSNIKKFHKDQLGEWSFEQYMEFLITRLLVTIQDEKYHITNLGVEYLTWIARNGRSENRPL